MRPLERIHTHTQRTNFFSVHLSKRISLLHSLIQKPTLVIITVYSSLSPLFLPDVNKSRCEFR